MVMKMRKEIFRRKCEHRFFFLMLSYYYNYRNVADGNFDACIQVEGEEE